MTATGETVPEYVVVVLERIEGGRTTEAHHEAATFDEALQLTREAETRLRTMGLTWVAITIVNAVDYPRILEGATRTD